MKKISIRKKLVAYFLSIVFVFVMVNILFAVLHLFIVNKYEQISSNIFNQYKLINATSDLVISYNDYRNTPNNTTTNEYYSTKELINNIISGLQDTIVSQDSKPIFVGVRNTIDSVIKETDEGVLGIKEGNAQDATSHFVEANRKAYFVRENTANLILSEVKYSEEIKANVARINKLSLIFGGSLLFVIVLIIVIISSIWAKQLVSPLTKLSELAETIAQGKLESNVDPDLIKSKDEIGSLAQVFDLMLKKIRGNISELDKNNKELEDSKKRIEENNLYLGKTNKMMVDRELAMIKLKKKIQVLTEANPIDEDIKKRLLAIEMEGSIEGVEKK